jgi:hypothetical protein
VHDQPKGMAVFLGRLGNRNYQVDGKTRPKQRKKPSMLEWLNDNPIAMLGD